MSHKARLWCIYKGGSFWRCLCCLTVFTSCLGLTAVSGCSKCTETLTGLLGQFSSPCFPSDYLPNLKCRWTILAPPGFIVQLTFHDFDLEEAQGCPYDFVSIETGAEKIKFCGVTAKGHTLNSTRNEMIVEFKTDFSIQKNGFSATYRRVAVSLRNQKVAVDKSPQRQAVSVSPSVSIPDLQQFTVCLEAKSVTVKKQWVLFSYLDSNNLTLINVRSTGSAVLLEISNVECDVSDIWEDYFSGEAFTGTWRQLCITWDGASGDIVTQTQNRYQLNHCPDSKGKDITGRGFLTLAPNQRDASKSFSGQLYNFRLWNFTMSGQSLVGLPCEEVGSVVDWENSHWDIPVSMLEADSALSCATALPTPPTVRPTCSSLGSGCQATSPANSNTLTTNTHTTNSVDPSTNGTNTPLTEVTSHGSRETTDLRQRNNTVSQSTTCNCSDSEAGSFNEPDLQRFQVLSSEFWQRSTSQMKQRSGGFRNPLGIISTPLRFPPRPSALKPMFPNVHSASIVFTKTVTKNSRVPKDSKDLEVAADSITAKKHLPPSFFPNIAGGHSVTDQDANTSGLTSEFLSRLKKLGRHFWDLELADKNSTGNVTGDSFEMTPLALESHESLANLGSDAEVETLSLKPSISSILLPNHHSSGQRSSDGLNILEIQPQTPLLVLYQPINPTPTGSLHEESADSIVSHGHLLHGSLWPPTSDMSQLGNPLNPLGDQFLTETSASLQGNIESSIDFHRPKFCSDHPNTKSSSTASPEDNSLLTSWPSSLLDPGSIISSLPFERDNSFKDTQLRPMIEPVHPANTSRASTSSTQRLLISTEQIANQLWQSQEVTLHPGQFSVKSQIDGTSSLVKDVDNGPFTTSSGLHIKMDRPDGLEFVSTTPIMSDVVNTSPIPDNFLDVSLRSSNSEFSAGLSLLQASTGKLSLGSPESSVLLSISPTVQLANASTMESQPGSTTSIPWSWTSVATRVLESLLENASPVENSQWRSSGREARTSLFPVSQTFTDTDYSQVLLTGVTLHNTRSQLPAPVVTGNKWAITTVKATGSLADSTWVSQVALHTPSILPSGAPYLENGSLTTNGPHPGNRPLISDGPDPGNGSLTTDGPHPGNGSLTSDTSHPGNGSLTTDGPHPGNGSLTSDGPHPGNGSLTTDTPHSEMDTLTFDALQRKNGSNDLHPRSDSSAVVSSLKSSLEASLANVWSSRTVPLDQRPEVTVLFQSSDVDQNIRSENVTLLHPDRLSKLDQIPTLTLNSSHGYTNGVDFPSFSPTVPGSFQENWGVFQANHSGVIAGSYSQENFAILATRREMEAQTLALSLDRTDSLLEEDSRSPASLESSNGQGVMTLLPVDLGAPLPSLSTHTTSLSKEPQLGRSSGIFTRAVPEVTLASRSVQSSNDTRTLNTASTIQKYVKTLDHHTSEIYVRDPHTYNLGLQSFPLGEGISGTFSAMSMGTQLSAGSPGIILVPTLPMDFPVVPSMSEWAWEIGMSMKTNKQLLKGSQTSTHLPRLQSSSSSAVVTSPPVLLPDVPGFSVTFSSGVDSRGPSVALDQASWHCPCEAIVGNSCLCGMLIADRGVFYRTQFVLYSQSGGSIDIGELEQKVSEWLTKSFQNWNYTVYVETVRIFERNTSTHQISSRSIKDKRSVLSYFCKAILYFNITKNFYLEEQVVQERLVNTSTAIGNNLSIVSINVQPIVNCSLDENPTQYKWTDTRPRVTLFLPCLSNPSQRASRRCLLNTQNYTSYWEPPDLTNCSISPSSNTSDFPPVSADNAADVANQLLDFTADKNLTREQVNKLVETLNQIVTVSEINSSLASTVLTVLSNILSSSDNALTTSSQVALRTVDALTAKMIFSGPSVSITTPNLAIGISAIDSHTYNGTSFSVGSQDGESELEVSLDRKPRRDTLAEIELSPGVFERLTEEEISEVSRTQFAFFSRTGLFQDPRGFSLQSFVVASSVGNITISNLSEPVRIRIKHRNPEEKFKPLCAFWDLTLNNGSGGWSTHGCHADPRSSASETICLCNHLTHFGVLLDISGTAQQIDAVNTKILTFITHIGCGISAIFSATTLLTYVAFEKLRRDYPSKILMNLSTSLFFLNFTFLIDGWLASFNVAGLCIAVAALLHFFLLASFTWMGLEAVHMYIALVKVFNTYIRKYMLKFCIIGWGLPALVVVIVLAIDRRFYGMSLYGKDASDSGASEFCWINNRVVFYVTCVCYFAVLFLMNVSMFIVVLIQICGRNGKKSNRNLREEILRNLRSVTSLTFLLGMTWGFAFFAWGPVNLSFMYLFAIFNSLQGFFIFVFHCALKENVQKQWRRYLCCGRFRLPENSDWSRTITNNTKKVSSENLGKSLSSSSIGSNSTSWSSKFKSGSSLFKSSTKGGLLAAVTSSKFGRLDAHQEPVVPAPNVLDKVTSYYPTHSDNFYKNIMMSENFSHSTKF